MGCEPDPDGINLEFYDATGAAKTREDVFGGHAVLYSRNRPVDYGSNDPKLGSQDWITDILVADSPDRLKTMQPTDDGGDQTSICSRNVLVQWHVGEEQGKAPGVLTIADGSPGKSKFVVSGVRVLDKDTQMDERHAMWDDWVGKIKSEPEDKA
jgi:hypothetical protein